MKQILVTGAAGFIGAAVAKHLFNNGIDVITIDNLSTGFEENVPKGITFLKGNCQDEQLIGSLSKYRFDCIIHIAGQSSGEISFDNPVYDLQTNTQSTLLLLKLAIETGCKKLIYASSMSVYGDKLDGPAYETDVPNPKSFYGIGKLASEHYMRLYEQFGITSTSLRLCNVYGPGQNLLNLRQGMVSIFLKQAIDSNSIHIKGSPDRFRDFIYISDVVNAFHLALQKSNAGYECYNVTNNRKISVGELINTLVEELGRDVKIQYRGSTLGDQIGVYGDNTKIMKELGFLPEFDLRKGLAEMIKWAKTY